MIEEQKIKKKTQKTQKNNKQKHFTFGASFLLLLPLTNFLLLPPLPLFNDLFDDVDDDLFRADFSVFCVCVSLFVLFIFTFIFSFLNLFVFAYLNGTILRNASFSYIHN